MSLLGWNLRKEILGCWAQLLTLLIRSLRVSALVLSPDKWVWMLVIQKRQKGTEAGENRGGAEPGSHSLRQREPG